MLVLIKWMKTSNKSKVLKFMLWLVTLIIQFIRPKLSFFFNYNFYFDLLLMELGKLKKGGLGNFKNKKSWILIIH